MWLCQSELKKKKKKMMWVSWKEFHMPNDIDPKFGRD